MTVDGPVQRLVSRRCPVDDADLDRVNGRLFDLLVAEHAPGESAVVAVRRVVVPRVIRMENSLVCRLTTLGDSASTPLDGANRVAVLGVVVDTEVNVPKRKSVEVP